MYISRQTYIHETPAVNGSKQWSTPRGWYHPVMTDRFVYVTEDIEEYFDLDRIDRSGALGLPSNTDSCCQW